MVSYKCEICKFTTNIKSHFNRHLNTKKHHKNIEIQGNEEKKSIKETQKRPKRDPVGSKIGPKRDPKETQKRPSRDPVGKFECEFCNSEFKNRTHLYRHIKNRCKVLKKQKEENEALEKQIVEQKIKHKKELEISQLEKDKLYDYIDKLLEKQGNITTTNIHIDKQLNQSNSQTNNITLNSYGQEDLSHITDKMKMNLIQLPYTSVQKMIEQVHFSNKKPENKNIAITNKKENMIKVYKDNKWSYKDRNETIDELIQINYGRLDDYYENKACEQLSDMHNRRYKKYQNKFDNDEIKLIDLIKKETEMIILSANL